jgi:ParB family chromosome partitioning protein
MIGTQDSNAIKVKDIPVGDIQIRENIRKEYNDIAELTVSIRQYGLLQPITVYPDEKETYVVKTGHRRFLAWQQLAKEDPDRFTNIRCLVSNGENTAIVQLVENIQRKDLSPIDLYNALCTLREQSFSNKKIADVMGREEGYVNNLFMGVNEISKDEQLKDFLKTHAGVSLSDVAEVKGLPPEQRDKILEERSNGDNRATMRKKIRAEKKPKQSQAPVTNGIEAPQKVAIPIRLTISPETKELTISTENHEDSATFDCFVEDIRHAIEQGGKYTIVNEPVNI